VRQIVKRPEPASLTTYRHTPSCTYDDYREKDELRDVLVAEQGALCCYCMGTIGPDWGRMKIEHWRSKTRHPQDQLKYLNLLGGCMGGETQPYRLQHCDTHKRNADLRYNPANSSHHIAARIIYGFDGSVGSTDIAFSVELNDVLNLNLPHLKNNRKRAWDAVLQWWKSEKNRLHRQPSKTRIKKKITQQTGPYCQAAVYLLQRKLAEMS